MWHVFIQSHSKSKHSLFSTSSSLSFNLSFLLASFHFSILCFYHSKFFFVTSSSYQIPKEKIYSLIPALIKTLSIYYNIMMDNGMMKVTIEWESKKKSGMPKAIYFIPFQNPGIFTYLNCIPIHLWYNFYPCMTNISSWNVHYQIMRMNPLDIILEYFIIYREYFDRILWFNIFSFSSSKSIYIQITFIPLFFSFFVCNTGSVCSSYLCDRIKWQIGSIQLPMGNPYTVSCSHQVWKSLSFHLFRFPIQFFHFIPFQSNIFRDSKRDGRRRTIFYHLLFLFVAHMTRIAIFPLLFSWLFSFKIIN